MEETKNPFLRIYLVVTLVLVVSVSIYGVYSHQQRQQELDELVQRVIESSHQESYEKCVDKWPLSEKRCYDIYLADDD
jgi:hypothetical protein